jgi:hypothetical protein
MPGILRRLAISKLDTNKSILGMKFTRNGNEILLKWGIGDEIHKIWG